MIGKTISHYTILEKLGEGGMGVVYKARDTKLDRLVALKFLPQHLTSDPHEKDRLIREAKAASALNHANITIIYEIDEFEGQTYIVMEYCDGQTLKQMLEKRTPSVEAILDIGIQLCEGLTAAHEKDIVHRDIKSSNIMVTSRGQAKIMDFGLARQAGANVSPESDSTGGTAAYMSPEQVAGEEVDRRSDIFSVGVVLYELLTGRMPFEGEHQAAILYSILNEEPQPIVRFNSQVSKSLEEIVFKALAKDREERYQHIDDLLADLRRERRRFEAKAPQIPEKTPAHTGPRRPLSVLIPTALVFILALLILVLKPFRFEVGPEERAQAQDNSLAIMYFDNMVDPQDADRIAQMITSLLITDLSESRYMRVVSRQRLYDILKLLGKEDLKVIDKTIASEVAHKAGVEWILTGGILQTEPSIILTSDISEAATGKVLATQRVAGEEGENLFSVVDKLSAQIKDDLSLPEGAKRELDRPVAEVTTHSPEAYRHYLDGMDFANKVYSSEARESFEKALALDSTFAMAYLRLATLTEGSEQRKLVAKAVKYADNVSQKERHYIKSFEAALSGDQMGRIEELKKIIERYPEEKEAYYWLGIVYYFTLHQYEDAIGYFHQAIEVDPLYKTAYNILAYAYNRIGNFEKSIWAIDTYISLAPDEANPYDSRADLFAYNGKLDQAMDSYEKALVKKPDFFASLEKLGHMNLLKRAYARAESCYQELTSCSEKEHRSRGRAFLALIPLYQGKFDQALDVLDNGIAADRMERAEGVGNTYKYLLKALIYMEKGDQGVVLSEIEQGMKIQKSSYPENPIGWRDLYAYFLAEAGRLDEAQAVLSSLKEDIERKDQSLINHYWRALGMVEQARGDAKSAIVHLEKEAQMTTWSAFVSQYTLAEAYLESGRLGEAVATLEQALSRYDEDRLSFPTWAVKAHYILGLAYERSGWNKRAVEKYEEFLDIWNDADPGIAEVEDARSRLEKLRATS